MQHNSSLKNEIITKQLLNPYDVDRNFFVLTLKKQVPYLDVLEDARLKHLYYKSHRHIYCKDQVLFEYGSPCDCIFVILSGIVAIELINNKKEVIHQIDLLGRGSVLGQNSVLSGNTWFYRARVCSEQSLNVVQVPRQSIKKLSL